MEIKLNSVPREVIHPGMKLRVDAIVHTYGDKICYLVEPYYENNKLVRCTVQFEGVNGHHIFASQALWYLTESAKTFEQQRDENLRSVFCGD